ncbi:MAG: VWA domain-containing protein [Rhodospirillaceae bacterium]|nr:VWA domain-containing protein [Rhodospirillaceae bacterium]MBL6932197.1 VWA domain-containing protein [Rhodospirillales bacterium]
MSKKGENLPSHKSSKTDVNAFLDKVARTPTLRTPGKRGRLLFGMDATASRQPMWDRAAKIQGEMFTETAAMGGLDLQLAYYRGFGEFKASNWVNDGEKLLKLMTSVFCLAGETQIGKLLDHTIRETKKNKINALVFIGDCVEEDVDKLGNLAGELGILGVPVFMFQEGNDPIATYAFKQIAKLTGGACCRFDASSAHVLKELLNAVAVFVAGGRPALEDRGRKRGGEVLKLINLMKEK